MENKQEELTVLIPIRIDSVHRMENLLCVVDFLLGNFPFQVMVSEAGAYENGILRKMLPGEVSYRFTKDNDPVYYRTMYINDMMKRVRTRYVAVWDADVLVPTRQVLQALEYLQDENCDVVYPYDGTFLDTGLTIRKMFMRDRSIDLLERLREWMPSLYGNAMRGGAFMIKTDKYIAAGVENLNFYGWSPEDSERYERWLNLGYKIKTVNGCMFHLSHPRDINGMHNSMEQQKYTYYEKHLTVYSSADEIAKRMNLKDYKHE